MQTQVMHGAVRWWNISNKSNVVYFWKWVNIQTWGEITATHFVTSTSIPSYTPKMNLSHFIIKDTHPFGMSKPKYQCYLNFVVQLLLPILRAINHNFKFHSSMEVFIPNVHLKLHIVHPILRMWIHSNFVKYDTSNNWFHWIAENINYKYTVCQTKNTLTRLI